MLYVCGGTSSRIKRQVKSWKQRGNAFRRRHTASGPLVLSPELSRKCCSLTDCRSPLEMWGCVYVCAARVCSAAGGSSFPLHGPDVTRRCVCPLRSAKHHAGARTASVRNPLATPYGISEVSKFKITPTKNGKCAFLL